MRGISRELPLPIEPGAAFALLHSPAAIRKWWSATSAVVAARPDGVWIAAWGPEEAPEYVTVSRILVWDPPHRLRLGHFEYFAREGGLPFDDGIETEFTVGRAAGGCVLTVRQEGFPADASADAFFEACERGWAATFNGIRRFVEERRTGAQVGGR
jgi:uncharacterized protein YndB with AHSA1/START domain